MPALDRRARRGRRVAVDHQDLAAVADRARYGLVGFPCRSRRLDAVDRAIGLADRRHVRRRRIAHELVAVHEALREQRDRLAVFDRRPHALLEDRRRLRVEIDLVAQQREPDVGLARKSGDGAEVRLEHRQPEHGVDGRDHLGHAEDQRLARMEQVLGRFEARLRRRIGDAPHRRRDQRLQVGDLCACSVEAEQQPHQQLAGADQHRGAVARRPGWRSCSWR